MGYPPPSVMIVPAISGARVGGIMVAMLMAPGSLARLCASGSTWMTRGLIDGHVGAEAVAITTDTPEAQTALDRRREQYGQLRELDEVAQHVPHRDRSGGAKRVGRKAVALPHV